MNHNGKKIALVLALLLLALLSAVVLGDKLADPATYTDTIAAIEEKTDTVLKLTASATLASAGVSAIPGDTATPIAQKLADFSGYFLLILCALYAEKYLLTLVGAAACRFLFPAACALFALGLFWKGQILNRLGIKLLVITLALLAVVPVSVNSSDMVYDAFRQSIDSTLSAAEELGDETSALAEASEDKGTVARVLDMLSETTGSLLNKAANTLNRFVETLAILIVTSCVIPVLVLLAFLWLIRRITGLDLRELRREA